MKLDTEIIFEGEAFALDNQGASLKLAQRFVISHHVPYYLGSRGQEIRNP
jgi:hypothetical protein